MNFPKNKWRDKVKYIIWKKYVSLKIRRASIPTAVIIPLNMTCRRCFFIRSLPDPSSSFCYHKKEQVKQNPQHFPTQ